MAQPAAFALFWIQPVSLAPRSAGNSVTSPSGDSLASSELPLLTEPSRSARSVDGGMSGTKSASASHSLTVSCVTRPRRDGRRPSNSDSSPSTITSLLEARNGTVLHSAWTCCSVEAVAWTRERLASSTSCGPAWDFRSLQSLAYGEVVCAVENV